MSPPQTGPAAAADAKQRLPALLGTISEQVALANTTYEHFSSAWSGDIHQSRRIKALGDSLADIAKNVQAATAAVLDVAKLRPLIGSIREELAQATRACGHFASGWRGNLEESTRVENLSANLAAATDAASAAEAALTVAS